MTVDPEALLAPHEVATGLARGRADDVVVLLAAMGIPADSRRRLGEDGWTVVTAEEDAARARALVAEEYPDGVAAPEPVRPTAARAPLGVPVRALWLGRADWAVALAMAACVAWFARMQGGAPLTRARLLGFGAITWDQVWLGEWWRLASAVFVHFDGVHLLANMVTLLLVGPPLANLLGPRRFLLIFVATGIAGNLASHVLAPSASLKAGASGAIAGVLGALGGTGLDPGWGGRFARWQVVGALFAIYALLVGAGAAADHVAHLAGLVAGIVLGAALTPAATSAARPRATDSAASSTHPSAE